MKKILVILSTFVFLLVGCSSTPTGPVAITIDMTEFSYSPDVLELKVGQIVTITLNNEGAITHEIMFGRDAVMVDGKANGFATDLFEFAGVIPEGLTDEGDMGDMDGMDMGDEEHDDGADDEHAADADDEHAEHSGYMTMIETNGSPTTITFTVTEEMVGEWEFGCFVDGGTHYAAGMFGSLVVTN